jgi:hypothetical protein
MDEAEILAATVGEPPPQCRDDVIAEYNRFVDQLSLDVSDSARLFADVPECGGRDHQHLERQVPLRMKVKSLDARRLLCESAFGCG